LVIPIENVSALKNDLGPMPLANILPTQAIEVGLKLILETAVTVS
jgi:hypothetical protein